jgi:spore maturation protein SpmB
MDLVLWSWFAGIAAVVAAVVGFFSSLPAEKVQEYSTFGANVILFSIIIAFIVVGVKKKLNVYDCFIEGAKEGFQTVKFIAPTMIALLVAVGTLRASGALDFVAGLIRPAAEAVGFPAELVPLVVVKLFSSSAATGLVLDIFKEYGEGHFRALETALLKYLENSSNASRGPAIISTGGGVVLSAQNRAILRRLGYVAWLDVTVDVLIERTSRSANRPLLNTPERFSVITDLCNHRIPLYEEASHIRIETSTMDVLKVVDMVHASAIEYFCHFDQ